MSKAMNPACERGLYILGCICFLTFQQSYSAKLTVAMFLWSVGKDGPSRGTVRAWDKNK